jgi:hypothetical protein
MSSCACRRWGPGTSCEKPINTDNSRELEAKMKLMMAEREKQSSFWKTTQLQEQVASRVEPSTTSFQETPSISETNKDSKETPPAQQLRFWN